MSHGSPFSKKFAACGSFLLCMYLMHDESGTFLSHLKSIMLWILLVALGNLIALTASGYFIFGENFTFSGAKSRRFETSSTDNFSPRLSCLTYESARALVASFVAPPGEILIPCLVHDLRRLAHRSGGTETPVDSLASVQEMEHARAHNSLNDRLRGDSSVLNELRNAERRRTAAFRRLNNDEKLRALPYAAVRAAFNEISLHTFNIPFEIAHHQSYSAAFPDLCSIMVWHFKEELEHSFEYVQEVHDGLGYLQIVTLVPVVALRQVKAIVLKEKAVVSLLSEFGCHWQVTKYFLTLSFVVNVLVGISDCIRAVLVLVLRIYPSFATTEKANILYSRQALSNLGLDLDMDVVRV